MNNGHKKEGRSASEEISKKITEREGCESCERCERPGERSHGHVVDRQHRENKEKGAKSGKGWE